MRDCRLIKKCTEKYSYLEINGSSLITSRKHHQLNIQEGQANSTEKFGRKTSVLPSPVCSSSQRRTPQTEQSAQQFIPSLLSRLDDQDQGGPGFVINPCLPSAQRQPSILYVICGPDWSAPPPFQVSFFSPTHTCEEFPRPPGPIHPLPSSNPSSSSLKSELQGSHHCANI